MRLFTPIVPDPRAPLVAANPVAKLLAALVLLTALFASLDGVTAAIILAALLGLVPFSGVAPGLLVQRTWLVGIAAVSIAVVNTLFAAEQSGPTVVAIGPIHIGAETLVDGIGLAVRLLAIVLAGILATVTSEPVEMADALIQQARFSPRFAIAVLASLRLLPLMAVEWQTIGIARRARGVEAGRSPIAAIGLFLGRLLALLVGTVRRASRLAIAMEARGFGALACRSVARPRHMRGSDWAWIGGALVLAAAAVGISVALGTWRPLVG
jgi:energy-coupling factor transport system permease protein